MAVVHPKEDNIGWFALQTKSLKIWEDRKIIQRIWLRSRECYPRWLSVGPCVPAVFPVWLTLVFS